MRPIDRAPGNQHSRRNALDNIIMFGSRCAWIVISKSAANTRLKRPGTSKARCGKATLLSLSLSIIFRLRYLCMRTGKRRDARCRRCCCCCTMRSRVSLWINNPPTDGNECHSKRLLMLLPSNRYFLFPDGLSLMMSVSISHALALSRAIDRALVIYFYSTSRAQNCFSFIFLSLPC